MLGLAWLGFGVPCNGTDTINCILLNYGQSYEYQIIYAAFRVVQLPQPRNAVSPYDERRSERNDWKWKKRNKNCRNKYTNWIEHNHHREAYTTAIRYIQNRSSAFSWLATLEQVTAIYCIYPQPHTQHASHTHTRHKHFVFVPRRWKWWRNIVATELSLLPSFSNWGWVEANILKSFSEL